MERSRNPTTPTISRLVRGVVLLAAGFAFWVLLAWPLSPTTGRVLWGEVAVGLLAAALAALLMGASGATRFDRLVQPRRYLWSLVYVVVFTWYVIRGNLDVAYRVLHPALPIRPGIVRATTKLRSATARTLLANSITLTPGTLTVDIVGDVFYIHCIHVDTSGEAAFAARILGRFEGLVARILE